MLMSVVSRVRAYEQDGAEIRGLQAPHLHVEAHWNDNDRVVLVWPNGEKLTVLAKDLRAAIDNGVNSARF